MTFEPKLIATQQLLQYYSQILEELRGRKIVRTFNNPIGDYAEWLIANQLGLTLAKNSTSGHDAVDSMGLLKFQIKARRLTAHNKSRQLSPIRNLKNRDFDYLIAALFNQEFEVMQVVKIPHEIIEKYAHYKTHVNAHILILRDDILSDPLVVNLTAQFRS